MRGDVNNIREYMLFRELRYMHPRGLATSADYGHLCRYSHATQLFDK